VPAGGGTERLAELVGVPRALVIIASSDDYDAQIAERYGWINRAIPDPDLNAFVDTLARRLASFDPQALAAAKRLVRRRVPASADDYRESLECLRSRITSPTTNKRRAAVADHAAKVGKDLEVRMGHHLGLIASGREPE